MAKILVIDDDHSIRYMITRLMNKHNHEVEEAFSVGDAIDKLNANTPDIVTCDLMIAEESGLDFIAYCKNSKDYQDLPIIVISAVGDTNIRQTPSELGVKAVLTKPFSSKMLIDVIEATLEG